jgi:hypothetical protein
MHTGEKNYYSQKNMKEKILKKKTHKGENVLMRDYFENIF